MFNVDDDINNKYSVRKILGRGENSNVYLVTDSKTHKEYILKEFLVRLENPHQLKISISKFEREISLLAGLKFAGSPTFIEHFTLDGNQYLVLECIHGRSLKEVLEYLPRPMDEKKVLELGIQIAKSVSLLHSQSPPVIFRNLKPSNIMITPDNRVILIDFALGRHFYDFRYARVKGIGTPGYSPPEQMAQGDQDEKTDVYAIGAILHQMATLRNPTELKNVFSFPPPSQLNARISREFDGVIARAVAYDRRERYDTVDELIEDLEKLQGGMAASPARQAAGEEKEPEPVAIPPGPPPGAKVEFFEARSRIGLAREREKEEDEGEEVVPELETPSLKLIVILIMLILAGAAVAGLLWKLGYIGGGQKAPAGQLVFPDIKEKRILEYRNSAIENYNKGQKSGRADDLARAASGFSRVISAYPSDAASQAYLENTRVLLLQKPYLRVAAQVSLTGEDYETGVQVLAGAALAQSAHNRKKDARPILLEFFDDGTSLENTIKLATDMGRRKDILAVIGPVRTPFLDNVAPFLNGVGIVLISPTGSCPDTENLGEYVFRMSGDGRKDGGEMADLAVKKLGLKRIAVVYDPSQGFSKYLGQDFIEAAGREEGSATREFQISLDSTDYLETVKKIKEYKPDGIFFTGYQAHQVRFSTLLQKEGVKAVQMGTVGIYSPQVPRDGGSAVEGAYLYSYFFPEEAKGSGAEFVRLFREKFGMEPNFRAAMAYDSMLTVAGAVEKGIDTPSALSQYLKGALGTTHHLEGATGEIKFDRFGRRADVKIVILQIKNGKFTLYGGPRK
jgi:serine/threonine-protein kinase